MSKFTYVTGQIKVVQIPDGEAPLWVRKSWVGLTLPVVATSNDNGYGVLSLKKSKGRCKSFEVEQIDALDALRSQSMEAAQWFRNHGYPMDTKGVYFSFKASQVEVLEKLKEKRAPNVRQFLGLLEVGVGAHDHPANIKI